MDPAALKFVHLSDIHLADETAESHWDPDQDIRHQLARDIAQQQEIHGKLAGILVTGDIAFKASKTEYECAARWLETLCGMIGCESSAVWICPGNHDVDRSKHGAYVLTLLHDTLRSVPEDQIDATIQKICFEENAGQLIFSPLTNYNEFAQPYQCAITPQQPFWTDNLLLNDGSILCLVGLTSALISNASDNREQNKLVLGQQQLSPLKAEPGVQYLVLCHHPPDWLRDQDTISKRLCNRAHIQLFGHKHTLRIMQIENSVMCVAGALHPERAEKQWLPTYNIIGISVDDAVDERHMNVSVVHRMWSEQHDDFRYGPTDSESGIQHFRLPLPSWHPERAPQTVTTTEATEVVASDDPAPVDPPVSPERRLAYRFLTLPYMKQMEIAVNLKLLHDEDGGLDKGEMFRRIFRRAKDGNLVARLWDEVDAAHPNGCSERNPFKE